MKRIERVMLVYPNQRWHKDDLSTTWNLNPYTICLLATMIKDDVDVKVVDAQFYDLSHDDFRKEIEEYKPDLLGISLLSSEYGSIGNYAIDIAKKVNEKTVIVLGGVHVTTSFTSVMNNKKVDYAVIGEGEYVLKNLIRFLNNEGSFPQAGVVSRNKKGQLKVQERVLVEDLNALPFPDYSFIDMDAYINKVQRYGIDAPKELPFIRMPTVRGCPVGCSFCQVENVSGKKQRLRSAENVVAELELLIEKYGIRSVNFEDDNALFNKKRSKELLRLMIKRNLNLHWKANGVALFSFDDELLDLMAKSGCLMVNVAIESGVERVLKNIVQKPIDLEKAPDMIKRIKSHGIYVCVNFIIGLPGETWDELRETLDYAEKCDADYVKIFIAQPIPGTRLFDMAKSNRYIVGDENVLDWRNGRIRTPEFNERDISILRAFEWDRINFTDPQKRERSIKMMGVTEAELKEIRKKTRDALEL